MNYAERNAKIAAYAQANPCMTLEQMGQHHGVTRERIRQILKRYGIRQSAASARRRAHPIRLCIECSKPLGRHNKRGYHITCTPKVELVCYFCGTKFTRTLSAYRGAAVNPHYTLMRPTCSKICPSLTVTAPCAYCGLEMRLNDSSARSRHRRGKRLFCCLSHSSLFRHHGAAV